VDAVQRLVEGSSVQHIALDDFGFFLDLGTEFVRIADKTAELHRLLLKQREEPTANVATGPCQQNERTLFNRHFSIVYQADRYNASMFLIRKPSPSFVRAFLEEQAKLAFTYPAVGATAGTPPLGFVVDYTRIKLGNGPSVFAAAKNALQRWEQFCLGWVEPCWPDTPIEPGQVVGVLARTCCLWSLNACRIVYVVNEPEIRICLRHTAWPRRIWGGTVHRGVAGG
jgi:hypothetical protein